MLNNLEKYDVVLASKSPRRQDLLKGLGIDFTVMTADVEETYPESLGVEDVPAFLSKKKAHAFEGKKLPENFLLIAADTVVICDDFILGKPKDEKDAERMLKMLSGRTHKVITGVTVLTAAKTRTFSVTSEVTFDILEDEEIKYYIDAFHPYDKAGAYGVQEWIGYVGVAEVRGSYYNVMGLPTQRLYQVLKHF